MKKIKTFENALSAIGKTTAEFHQEHVSKSADAYAYEQLKVIVEALNEGWKANWKDLGQFKYYPYFSIENGFSFYGVVYCNFGFSSVGSRLCFKSRELAEYAGKQFTAIYETFFTA